MSAVPIKLPPLGMKSEKIHFGAWLAGVGERVLSGQELYEVEADKATVVVDAEETGVLESVLVTEGLLHEGDILGYINAG